MQQPHTHSTNRRSNGGSFEQDGSTTSKRPKAIQACTACKKHKTRCERLENERARAGCHRCITLNVRCSFESGPSTSPASNGLGPHVQSESARATVSSTQQTSTAPHCVSDIECKMCLQGDIPAATVVRNRLSHLLGRDSLVPTPCLGSNSDPSELNDWTAAPMLAMQDLFRPPASALVDIHEETRLLLGSIMTEEQTTELLEIFEDQYAPWLNVPPLMKFGEPLVTLARCIVASRHLRPLDISRVVPRLTTLLDGLLPKLMFNPVPSTGSIEALLTLAMWSPIGPRQTMIDYDERLRAKSAVSLATNLRLHEASTYVNFLREQQSQQSAAVPLEDSPDLVGAKDLTRLWIALSNTESLLCLGTTCTPISRRSDDDIHAIETSSPGDSEEAGRDNRLIILSQVLDVTEAASRIRLQSSEDVRRWHKDVSLALLQLDSLYKKIYPLSIPGSHDQFYNHMLRLYYYACRLTMIAVCIHWARQTLGAENSTVPSLDRLVVDGVQVEVILGQDGIRCAQGILEVALLPDDRDLLGTAPDVVFHMISFSASTIMVINFALFQRNHGDLGVYAVSLLERMVGRLQQVARTDEHVAIQSAKMISALLVKWERRFSDTVHIEHPGSGAAGALVNAPLHNTGSAYGGPNTAGACPPIAMNAGGTSRVDPSDDLSTYLGSDVIMDAAFWDTFMNTVYNMPLDTENE